MVEKGKKRGLAGAPASDGAQGHGAAWLPMDGTHKGGTVELKGDGALAGALKVAKDAEDIVLQVGWWGKTCCVDRRKTHKKRVPENGSVAAKTFAA